jgi:hypothetical protein
VKPGAWRYTFTVDGALPGTEALQDLLETHSHRMLVIVVLVLINTLYVSDQSGIEPDAGIGLLGKGLAMSLGSRVQR